MNNNYRIHELIKKVEEIEKRMIFLENNEKNKIKMEIISASRHKTVGKITLPVEPWYNKK